MAATFAPYQDIPETQRALSPPIVSPRISLDRPRAVSPPARYEQHDYFNAAPASPPAWPPAAPAPSRFAAPREDVDMFTTSLGWRLDYEACLAYLLLPPAGGVLLLMLEHQSDYVRFHAWQSSLLFAFLFIVHVIFSWSGFLSWVLFIGDVGLIAWLTRRAYLDGECAVLRLRLRGLGLTVLQRRRSIDMRSRFSDRLPARYWTMSRSSGGRVYILGRLGFASDMEFTEHQRASTGFTSSTMGITKAL
jgi:uncharacterized membrane protein